MNSFRVVLPGNRAPEPRLAVLLDRDPQNSTRTAGRGRWGRRPTCLESRREKGEGGGRPISQFDFQADSRPIPAHYNCVAAGRGAGLAAESRGVIFGRPSRSGKPSHLRTRGRYNTVHWNRVKVPEVNQYNVVACTSASPGPPPPIGFTDSLQEGNSPGQRRTAQSTASRVRPFSEAWTAAVYYPVISSGKDPEYTDVLTCMFERCTAPIARGNTEVGSGTERSVNHSAPPPGKPPTGSVLAVDQRTGYPDIERQVMDRTAKSGTCASCGSIMYLARQECFRRN
ncbi:MAG: hypothetical protein BJ554DRAFT_3652 [Olpidium bornovanus]|uniref:Uncharacterized protein n=1 Tax=Olpidium bornovanus TaxID=278681 RepID=A0A8H8DFT1_9FUNG|nr:MAG: hypothetical protein BJ554DRAFT_3652 [Olpidium bornovanus]